MKAPKRLFDNIILAIMQEKEQKQTKNILTVFTLLFLLSVVLLPFSLVFFADQWKDSGIWYFIGTAIKNSNIFFTLWQDFSFAILEALPIMGIVFLFVNIALLLFTVRLFLYKKALLLKYVSNRVVGTKTAT